MRLVLKQAEGAGREAVEVEDLEGTGDRKAAIRRLILSSIDDGRGTEADGRTDGVVRGVVTVWHGADEGKVSRSGGEGRGSRTLYAPV